MLAAITCGAVAIAAGFVTLTTCITGAAQVVLGAATLGRAKLLVCAAIVVAAIVALCCIVTMARTPKEGIGVVPHMEVATLTVGVATFAPKGIAVSIAAWAVCWGHRQIEFDQRI